MANITTRAGKGAALTHTEVDDNFTGLNTELGQKEVVANKGVANGYASLDGTGRVPSGQLPSYVDDVLEFANLAAFPATGETGKIYVALDSNKVHRWSGSAYVEISSSPGSTDSVPEGSTNLYFTQARARASVSGTAPISYNSGTGAFSHAASGVTAGTYGSATAVPVVTVNEEGHVTGVSTSAISGSLTFTGDVTGSGTTGGTTTLTLANSGVTAGSYGSASAIPVVTVDAKGRMTSVSTTAVNIPSGSLTFTGDVTGTGTTGASTTLTLANSGATAGTYTSVTVDAKGRVTAGTNPGFLTGNQTITLSGDATGSGATGIAVTLANSGVTAGTYSNASITVDAKGRVTSASSGAAGGVTSFNTRTGAVSLTSGDVTGALGYTPYNSSNPSGYISGITSGMVTTALGYTPYNSTNPNGYITSSGSITGSAHSLNLGGTGHTITASSWAGGGGYHGYTYSGGNFRFGFSSTAGVVDVYADGNFYATDSSHLVLHAGNYSGYFKSVNGQSIIGSGDISISASSATTTLRATIEDTRAGQRTPDNYDDYRTSWEFTNQIVGSDWHTAMTMQGWHDGYAAWQIIGPASTSAHENFYLRSGINSSWNVARSILHSGNYSSYSAFSGLVSSSGNNGFANATWFASVRNPIWSFGNASSYGISYYQGSAGIGGTDTIGIHPNGNTTAGGAAFSVSGVNSYVLGNIVLHAGNFTSYAPGSGSSWTFGDIYSNNWFRNNNSGQGLYNQATANHWYSDGQYWNVGYSGTTGIRLRNGHAGTVMGYLYGETNGRFGLLNAQGSWSISLNPDNHKHVLFGGGYGDNAYNTRDGVRLLLGGGDGDAQGNYYIGTNFNNYGGNYTKLDLAWHTGIRIGAQASYGGVRFFDSEDFGTVVFSVNTGDGNVRTTNTHYAYAFRGNGNVAGTGEAIYCPNGVYSTGTNWLYGTIHMNGNVISNAGYYEVSGGWRLNNGGSGYAQFPNWTRLDGHYGFYSGTNGAHFYPNNLDYGSWRMDGTRNGWHGLAFATGMTLMMNDNECGVHRDGQGWRFYVSGNSLFCNGNITAYWSDERLKENIRPLDGAMKIISSLQSCRFTWNALGAEIGMAVQQGKEEIGMIAQRVQEVLPDAVVVNESANKPNGEKYDYLTINYNKITPVILQAVKELNDELQAVKQQLAQIKSTVH